MPVTATPRGAIRTRPCQWEPRTGSASRRHTLRSRLDSRATMGGAHRPCQSLSHLAEPFGLARDNGRCTPEIVAPLLHSTPSSLATSVAEGVGEAVVQIHQRSAHTRGEFITDP
jgi:hypothetical protein